jgi:hypothetical protein
MPKIIVRYRASFVIAGNRGGYEAFVEGRPQTWEAGASQGSAIAKLHAAYLALDNTDISAYEVSYQ